MTSGRKYEINNNIIYSSATGGIKFSGDIVGEINITSNDFLVTNTYNNLNLSKSSAINFESLGSNIPSHFANILIKKNKFNAEDYYDLDTPATINLAQSRAIANIRIDILQNIFETAIHAIYYDNSLPGHNLRAYIQNNSFNDVSGNYLIQSHGSSASTTPATFLSNLFLGGGAGDISGDIISNTNEIRAKTVNYTQPITSEKTEVLFWSRFVEAEYDGKTIIVDESIPSHVHDGHMVPGYSEGYFGVDIFRDIEAAIAAADPYDIIEVKKGSNPSVISIDKPIKLIGPNHGTPGNSSREIEANLTTVLITSDDVMISGFRIYDVVGGVLENKTYESIVIKNNIFAQSNGSNDRIYFPKAKNLLIMDNYFANVRSDNNIIKIKRSNDAYILRNEFYIQTPFNNNKALIELGADYGVRDNMFIISNTFNGTGSKEAILIKQLGLFSKVKIIDNKFNNVGHTAVKIDGSTTTYSRQKVDFRYNTIRGYNNLYMYGIYFASADTGKSTDIGVHFNKFEGGVSYGGYYIASLDPNIFSLDTRFNYFPDEDMFEPALDNLLNVTDSGGHYHSEEDLPKYGSRKY